MIADVKRRVLLGVLCMSGVVHAVDNPLDVPLHDSVVRFDGKYAVLSGETNGVMLTSADLMNWGSPVQVFPSEMTGPFEMLQRNGTYSLYSAKGRYSVSRNPLSLFPDFRAGLIGGEDLRLYQDSLGFLYALNRKQGRKDEGEITAFTCASSWVAGSRPRTLLDGRRGMWDSLDSADLGEPELLDYRGKYYLLYAANKPGPRTGMREIGVAVSDKVARLETEDKLANPVLGRNNDRLARMYTAILPSAEYAAWEGRYTMEPPKGGWALPEFKPDGWRTGEGAFGYPFELDDTQLQGNHTKWKSDRLWVRRMFELRSAVPETPLLKVRHEGGIQVFLNGTKIYESSMPSLSYSHIELSEEARSAFVRGENVLAVHSMVPVSARYRHLDFGLYDAGEYAVEPIVSAVDKPRVLTGPNGFEKWLAYQAYWNGELGTGMDRIFFYEDEMVVDGPTTTNTPGYHPPPAAPSFADDFSGAVSNGWNLAVGEASVTNGVLLLSAEKSAVKSLLNRAPARHYLFEASLLIPPRAKGEIGVVAWSDGKKDLVISLDPARGSWSYQVQPGSSKPKKLKLPSAIKFNDAPKGFDPKGIPQHQLKVTKNEAYFEVWLDGVHLTAAKPLMVDLAGPGVPGVYAKGSLAAFGDVVYTVGWDEYGKYITGWGAAADGTAPSGEWRQDAEKGLEQRSHSTRGRAFKGDLLSQYEFTVNARTEELEEGKERQYGIFPVFADPENYLQAMIDTRARELIVFGKLGGREIEPLHEPLARKIPQRHHYDKNTPYQNTSAWVYGLRSESVVNGLYIRWLEGEYDYLNQEFFVPSDELIMRYAKQKYGEEPFLWDSGKFYDADEPKPGTQRSGVFNPVSIRPVVANNVGFGLFIYAETGRVVDSITKQFIRFLIPGEVLGDGEELGNSTELLESDTPARPQDVLVSVEVESSYFFRCVKLKDRVIIELNGKPMVTVAGEWPDSQVGLVTDGQPCFFNGMTLMHLPAE